MTVLQDKIIHFCCGEFKGWNTFDRIWLCFCSLATIGVSFYLGDSTLAVISSLTSTLYAIFAGKGKISCYFFGIINTILYGWISFKFAYYGETILNWGWYLPMMFAGIFFWKNKLNREQSIYKTSLSAGGRIITTILSLAGIAGFAIILNLMGDRRPLLDSATTVLSVSAMILTVKRCIEQWFIWFIVNILSIYMWALLFREGAAPAATLIMWSIALANSIIFFIQWYREGQNSGDKNE